MLTSFALFAMIFLAILLRLVCLYFFKKRTRLIHRPASLLGFYNNKRVEGTSSLTKRKYMLLANVLTALLWAVIIIAGGLIALKFFFIENPLK